MVVSCAMSVDGYLDDTSDQRLLLSNEADLDRVDEVRAGCDAILVGAGTVRTDDPRLVVRSAERRVARAARGQPESPIKVTLTASGALDPGARFFTAGESDRLVYCARPALTVTSERLVGFATVIDAGDAPDLRAVVADLADRGVRRLLVEGGGRVLTDVLALGLADELHLVVAPVFVGDPAAPRMVGPGRFPHHPGRGMTLAEARTIGDVVLLHYLLDRAPDE